MSNLPIKVVKWDAFAIWTFNSTDTSCSICRNELTISCVDCLNGVKSNDCKVTKGMCGHVFHYCCINNWRKKSNVCPICTTSWSTDTDDMNAKHARTGLSNKK